MPKSRNEKLFKNQLTEVDQLRLLFTPRFSTQAKERDLLLPGSVAADRDGRAAGHRRRRHHQLPLHQEHHEGRLGGAPARNGLRPRQEFTSGFVEQSLLEFLRYLRR